MFVAALFIIVKIWKQLRYASVGEWIKKKTVVHPDNGILFRAEKKYANKP